MGLDGAVALERANRLLEREVALASSGGLYLVVDLSEGRLELKAQGLPLRRFPMLRWNAVPLSRLPTGPHLLTRRQALRLPARPERRAGPSSSAEPGGPGERLSVRDMPSSYTLSLGPEASLFIVGEPPASLVERTLGLATSLVYCLRAGASWLSGLLGGTPRIVLRVVVPADAAKLLFWSLQDGTPFLIGGVASSFRLGLGRLSLAASAGGRRGE